MAVKDEMKKIVDNLIDDMHKDKEPWCYNTRRTKVLEEMLKFVKSKRLYKGNITRAKAKLGAYRKELGRCAGKLIKISNELLNRQGDLNKTDPEGAMFVEGAKFIVKNVLHGSYSPLSETLISNEEKFINICSGAITSSNQPANLTDDQINQLTEIIKKSYGNIKTGKDYVDKYKDRLFYDLKYIPKHSTQQSEVAEKPKYSEKDLKDISEKTNQFMDSFFSGKNSFFEKLTDFFDLCKKGKKIDSESKIKMEKDFQDLKKLYNSKIKNFNFSICDVFSTNQKDNFTKSAINFYDFFREEGLYDNMGSYLNLWQAQKVKDLFTCLSTMFGEEEFEFLIGDDSSDFYNNVSDCGDYLKKLDEEIKKWNKLIHNCLTTSSK